MKELTTSGGPARFSASGARQKMAWCLLKEDSYTVGHRRVTCWLCEHRSPVTDPREDGNALVYRIVVYGEGSCLMTITTDMDTVAETVFNLLIKYELSPYHVEDVLEDRGIKVDVRRL